eukprot:1157750-Pelagomonas_calceolata.AAC.6
MGKDTLESMPASDEPYKIKLSVTSFLGTSHSTTHSIKRANSTGTPTVIITTPSRAKVTQGITLDAEASRSSVCGKLIPRCRAKVTQAITLDAGASSPFMFGKGEYKWSCEGRTPAGASSSEPCSLLENEFGRRLNRKISMSELQQQGVQPGDKLTFKLVARYENQPDSESEAETSPPDPKLKDWLQVAGHRMKGLPEVEMLGADLQARLDGPSGTVQQSTDELVFNASGSSDPIASGDQNSGMESSFQEKAHVMPGIAYHQNNKPEYIIILKENKQKPLHVGRKKQLDIIVHLINQALKGQQYLQIPLASFFCRYLFGCTRLDAEGGYCFEPLSYRPAQQGLGDPTWTINATNFAAPDTTYLITVTVSKAGRTATASSVILLKSGEWCVRQKEQPCAVGQGCRLTTLEGTWTPDERLLNASIPYFIINSNKYLFSHIPTTGTVPELPKFCVQVTGVSVTRYCGGRQTTCPSTHNPTEPVSWNNFDAATLCWRFSSFPLCFP